MRRWNKGWIGVLILLTPIILLAAVWAYVNQLSQATESFVIASMEELSRHDMQNIQSELENSWDEISAVYSRTQASRCETIQEVCSRLNLEQVTNTFDIIYLVDSEGNTYSSANMVQDSSDKRYIQPLLSGEEKYVMRYDNLEVQEVMKENLVYAVRGEPFQVADVEFIGIVGFSKISMIEGRLKIDSFDGRGYTGIIDMDGNYVVNRDRSAGFGKIDNYFEQLQEHTDQSEKELEGLAARLNQKESFLERFNYTGHKTQVVSFVPISGTSWSIVLTVPEVVFNEQTQQFVVLTGVMLAVVVLVLCIMMLLIIRSLVASSISKAEARARGEFLSSMSHEIRTPLNGIVGLNHLMQQNIDDPEKLEEYLGKSASTAKYLLSLVNDILDMSKLQAGKMELVLNPFSVHELVSALESIMHGRMDDKDICFQIETDIQSPNIIGDEMRIEQILINILGNAVKFTPREGSITLRVRQSAAEAGRVRTIFEVEDTGCGMSEEFQRVIFDAFSQEHSTITRGMQGTGLGMSISSLLAEQMGGTLSVRSKLGEGSCFTFALEADITDEVRSSAALIAAMPDETGESRHLNILVAEDNELNAEILLELLKAAGFSVTHAADGGQVVELFRASAPYAFDVILMDVQMPVRSGYEATKIIRALNRPDAKTVLIYACTANTFKEDQDRAMDSGMDGFIAKPIDVNKLMQQLNKGK